MIDPTLKNAHIFIVDDQEANIDLLEGFLEMQGYTNIKTTTDPRKVLPMVSGFDPDLILLDLAMPYLTGFEVMEQLKTLETAKTFLPILVLTADATTDTKQRALSVGASDFITKPFDLIEVGLRIRNLLFSCHLMHQLENQNQILEDKVKERTAELENTNVDLLAALDKAEESDRLKTAFLLTISHEIRTPLNGILGFASLLAEQELPQDEKLEYVNVMHSSGDRLINTINDYVDMALIVSGNQDVKFELVNINKLLHEQVDKFKQRCENKGLRLILSIPEDQEKVTVQSDLELLRKIISHLLDNAIKFTKRGEINIGLSKKPGFIEFLVKDTGVGIEETAKERVFNIFMQGNNTITRSFEGSGLGLSIIRELLKLLGGEIRMESVEGEGTTFYFTLPLETRAV